MSFINKGENVVINAKLTTSGRKLLASGKLTFDKWAIGDSEIDYTYAENTGFDLSDGIIMRPKDKQPSIKYQIPPTELSTSSLKDITTIVPVELRVRNTATERGFFTGSTASGYTAQTTSEYVVQDNMVISLSGVTGGTTLLINQGSGFSLKEEPAANDYLVVFWLNPKLSGTTLSNGEVNTSINSPVLWYKIESVTGTIAGDNLQVTVDRDLPDFSSISTSAQARCYVYPSGDSISNFYGSGSTLPYWNVATLSFDSTCNIADDDVKVWNMNILYTESIIGTQTGYETYGQYGSSGYTGFKNYLSKTFDSPSQKAIGIIHYSNNSISNFYGEGLYDNTPVLEFPTVISHNATGSTMGLTLTCSSKNTSILGSGATNLNTTYYNLVDQSGNVYGKCFNNLKIFVIENEELLAALSYKSNRNWTYPSLTNAGNTSGIVVTRPNVFTTTTQKLYVSYMFESSTGYTDSLSYGYSNSLPNQIYTEYTPSLNTDGTLDNNQVPQFTLNETSLWYLADTTAFTGGTGLSFDKFKILTQLVSNTTTRPDPSAWKVYDYTSKLNNYSTWSGGTIPSSAFSSTIFSIDNNIVTGGTTFDISSILNNPTTANSDKLQFGDEVFFYGNIKTDIEALVYRSKFILKLDFNEYNTSINPTWGDTTQSVHVSDIGIYANQNGVDTLVAIAKLSYPLEKKSSQVKVLEVSIDF